jgi:glycosyltransferase involved in cell wall biosynthesis
MKLLFIIENYIPHIGGVEIVFKNLCEGLAKLGHEVSIITHRLKGTKRFETINGVKVYRINCFHSRYWFTFFSIPKALKLAKDADIIHTTTFNGAFPAWLVSKLRKKPCILTVHEVWLGKWKDLVEVGRLNAFMHNLLERLIYLLNFDKYIGVSKSTEKQLLDIGKPKNKVSYIYNGMDYEHWNPKRYNRNIVRKNLGIENKFVYMFTGRPGVSKGLEYLLKAVQIISKEIKDSVLVAIVSKDKAYQKRYDYIKNMIKSLKIGDKVILLDPIPYKDLPNYIIAADCIVVPSLSEGFGFAAAEACAMNIPVVTSDTTSLPEVVSGKYLLIKPKDEKAIADAVVSIQRGKYNLSKLKRFEIETNIEKYLNIYKSCSIKEDLG